jgi:FecR protein
MSVSILALSLPLGFAAPAFAVPKETAGQAEIVVSRVHGLLDDVTREIVVKDDVFSQEVIETGTEAATRIVFRDGTRLSMGPSSRVTLDRYVFDPKTGAGQLAMNFLSGVFEFLSGAMNEAGYDLRTPFAQLSVRGTDAIIDSNKVIVMRDGSVLSTTTDGQQFLISKGECLTVDSDQKWRVVTDSCDQFLNRYGTMIALLTSGVEPGAGPASPFDIIRTLNLQQGFPAANGPSIFQQHVGPSPK